MCEAFVIKSRSFKFKCLASDLEYFIQCYDIIFSVLPCGSDFSRLSKQRLMDKLVTKIREKRTVVDRLEIQTYNVIYYIILTEYDHFLGNGWVRPA
jgi:phospholipid N-methyltransferase